MTACACRRARRAGAVAIGVAVLLDPGVAPGQGTRAPSSRAAEPSPPSAERVHEVKRGDTLSALARRYRVSVAVLVATNRLRSPRATLRIGQRLVVPAAGEVARGEPGPREPARREARRGQAALRPPAGLVLAIPDFEEIAPLFGWPVEGPVTSTFGSRKRAWHRGIDIKAELGTPVQAAAPGLVLVSGVEPRYGRVIKIEHDNGFVTVYAHNDENLVEAGERVAVGDTVATIGRTGRATSYHLHFEIRRNGSVYNPLYLLPLPPRVAQVDETDEESPDDE